MSHYILGLIIKEEELRHGPQLATLLAERMAPYAEEQEVAPYKSYQQQWQIQAMREHYELPHAPIEALVPCLTDWTGLSGGADEIGLYVLTTYNHKATWDFYVIGGRFCGALTESDDGCTLGSHDPDRITESHLMRNAVRVREISHEAVERLHAILTPDDWIEYGRMGWFAAIPDPLPQREWQGLRSETLSAHSAPEYYLLGLDCHI